MTHFLLKCRKKTGIRSSLQLIIHQVVLHSTSRSSKTGGSILPTKSKGGLQGGLQTGQRLDLSVHVDTFDFGKAEEVIPWQHVSCTMSPGLQNAELHATAQQVKLLPLENLNWERSPNEPLRCMAWRYLPSSPRPASWAKVSC